MLNEEILNTRNGKNKSTANQIKLLHFSRQGIRGTNNGDTGKKKKQEHYMSEEATSIFSNKLLMVASASL